MGIVAISGSPRRGGNSELLLKAFLEGIEDQLPVKKYRLEELQLQGCKGCGGCYQKGICLFHDDIWALYEEVERSQALVVSSPIYFASITAQLKTFIDRAQPYWARRVVLKETETTSLKGGFFLSVGAMETEKYFCNALLIMKSFFHILEAPYGGDLFFTGVDNRDDIKRKDGALLRARKAGETFLKTLL